MLAPFLHKPVPSEIVIGIDGAPESVAAHAVAKQPAERFDTELVSVVAHGGEPVDTQLVGALVGRYRADRPDEPVLVAALADADLLVVGRRGLHDLKARGEQWAQLRAQARR